MALPRQHDHCHHLSVILRKSFVCTIVHSFGLWCVYSLGGYQIRLPRHHHHRRHLIIIPMNSLFWEIVLFFGVFAICTALGTLGHLDKAWQSKYFIGYYGDVIQKCYVPDISMKTQKKSAQVKIFMDQEFSFVKTWLAQLRFHQQFNTTCQCPTD